MWKNVLGIVAAALVSTSAAQASFLVYADTANFGPSSTNYNTTLTLNKYNGPVAIDLVKITFFGIVTGTAKVESLDAQGATINYAVSADIEATGPASLSIVVNPVAPGVFNASAFDGSIDFGGTSGFSSGPLSDSDDDSQSFVLPLDIAAFLGAGTFDLFVDADGSSSGSGAGNLLQQFSTSAQVAATVEYFSSVIPTPAALPAGLALLGAMGLRRSRR
jgi:hypothetical protein